MSAKRFRVAMIIQAYLPHVGGAERQLAALAPLLQARDVALEIVTRRYPGMSKYERIGEVPVHRLPVPGPKALASLSFTLTALPLLRRLQPDLIHAHELLSPTTTALLAKWWLGVPVVAKVLRGGELGDLAKLKKKPLGRQRMELFKEQIDGFAVISQEIEQELAQWGIPAVRRHFVPNGVDVQRFAPVSPGEKSQRRHELGWSSVETAVYAGRFVPEKCLEQLIELWPQVRQAFPQAELRLLGSGPQETALRKLAGRGVYFEGQVADVVPYLQAADVFILPSATEGLSNALLEAMAAGLPVIATRVGGAGDLIRHKRSGWLVPPREPAALKEATISLFADQFLAREIGAQARQRVEDEYALAATAERLVALYSRVSQRPVGNGIPETAVNADPGITPFP